MRTQSVSDATNKLSCHRSVVEIFIARFILTEGVFDHKGGLFMKFTLPFWQRLLITLAVMIVASLIVGYLWEAVLGFALPSYVGGMIGGLSALPVWDFLKRIRPSQKT